MKQVSDMVKKFFEDYERNTNPSNPELLASQFSDIFMFAGLQGAQAIKRDDFLKALPQREVFFKTIGLTSSKIQALEETRLNDKYVIVKAYWEMHFEKIAGQPMVDEIAATYLLYQQADGLRIVFQLDHQDLMKRVEELGLLSGQS